MEYMQKGHQERDKLIEQNILTEIKNTHELYGRDSLEILAWIARLDIKIAIRKDFGPDISPKIWHVMIIRVTWGNMVAFEGSPNESVGGLIENRESVAVDTSRKGDDWSKLRIKHMERDFDVLWDNNDQEYTVIP
jgi:hypothetical protein